MDVPSKESKGAPATVRESLNAATTRRGDAFGFVATSDEDARQIREFAREPAPAFVRDARLNVPFTELRQLNDFIKDDARSREIAPVKERSLPLFARSQQLAQEHVGWKTLKSSICSE